MVCQRATGRQRTSHCCWTRLGRHQGRPPKKTQARHHLLFLRGSCCSKRPGLVGWRRRAASELCSGLGDSHNGQNERTTLKKMTCIMYDCTKWFWLTGWRSFKLVFRNGARKHVRLRRTELGSRTQSHARCNGQEPLFVSRVANDWLTRRRTTATRNKYTKNQ
jgi:hypothetical protein